MTFVTNRSRVIYHQSSSIDSVEIHRNGQNLLKISATKFQTAQRFTRRSKKGGSVYKAKYHILSNSTEMSKMRLWKRSSCFTFKTKGIIRSATVASKKSASN